MPANDETPVIITPTKKHKTQLNTLNVTPVNRQPRQPNCVAINTPPRSPLIRGIIQSQILSRNVLSYIMQFIPLGFKNAISQLLKKNHSIAKFLSKEVVLVFIKEDYRLFDVISDELKEDERFIDSLLTYIRKESNLQTTEYLVLKIIAQKKSFLEIIKKNNPELFKDKEFIPRAIKQNCDFFNLVNEEVKGNAEFINNLLVDADKKNEQTIALKVIADIKAGKMKLETINDDNILKLAELDFAENIKKHAINKQVWLKDIFNNSVLYFLNENQKNNEKFVFALFNIRKFGAYAFTEFAGDNVKKKYFAVSKYIKQQSNCKKILRQLGKAYTLELIKVDYEIYRLLPKKWLQDEEYLRNIFIMNPKIYLLLSKEQKTDQAFFLAAAGKKGANVAEIIKVLYNNKKLICELLRRYPHAYNDLSCGYQDEEFFVAALDADPSVYLKHHNNPDFIKKFLVEGHNPKILTYLDNRVAKKIILSFVSEGLKVSDKVLGISLPLLFFVPDDLRKDVNFITDVLHREATDLSEKNQNQRFPFDLPKDIEFFGVHESLKSKEFISKLINRNRLHCESILQTITSKNLLLDLMKDNVANGYRTLMCYLGSHWRSNQEFILEAFKIEGNEIFEFINQDLKRKNFIAKLCVINANILKKIDASLINDKEFMFFLLQKNRDVSRYLNEQILFKIISNPFNFSFLSKELRNNLIKRMKESNEFCQKWQDVDLFDVSIRKLKDDLINQLRSADVSIRKLQNDPEVINAEVRKLIGKCITELAQGSFLAREILRHPQAYGMRNKLSDYLVNQLLTSKELSGEVELVEKIINEIIRALFLQLRENEEYINKMPRRIKVSELGEFWQEWYNLDLPIKEAIAFDNKKNDQNEPINIKIKNKTERCDLNSELGKFILQLVQNNFKNDIEKNALRLFHQIDHVVIFTRGTEEQSALLVFNSNNEGTSNFIEGITSGLNDGTRKNIKTTAIIGEDGTKKIVRSMGLSGYCVAGYDRNLFANNVTLRIFLPGLKELDLVENYDNNPCKLYTEANKGLVETAKRFAATPK